jgi:hypothetical protein
MSRAVEQFLQIIRETWRQTLYCPQCGCETCHIGLESGPDEIYTCSICHSQKVYTMK